jgi:hypothetical protein
MHLYEIRDRLHPLTQILIVGFVEVQDLELKVHDKIFIDTVYPEYFPIKSDI